MEQELQQFTQSSGASNAELELLFRMAQMAPRPTWKVIYEQSLEEIKMDSKNADKYYYTLPPRKNADGTLGDPIKGFSVRITELFLRNSTHFMETGEILKIEGQFVFLEGKIIDLEKLNIFKKPTIRQIAGKSGMYSINMISNTIASGLSIAMRNAVALAVPRVYLMKLEQEAREMVIAESQDPKLRKVKISEMVMFFASKKVGIERVLKALNINSLEEITPENMADLRGLATALNEGESADELFPIPVYDGTARSAKSALDDLVDPPQEHHTEPGEPPFGALDTDKEVSE